MALPIPSLDDRNFDKLYEEALRLIPRYCPEWTDHNPSDPGIILTELFAFLFDAYLYQLDILPEASYLHFAHLFNKSSLEDAIQSLNEISHAVSSQDFEYLLLHQYNSEILENGNPDKQNTLARVWISPAKRWMEADKYMNIVILPSSDKSYAPTPSEKDCQSVFTWLKKRCPITTKLEVIGPLYIKFRLDITVAKSKDTLVSFDGIRTGVEYALAKFLSPLQGGFDGKGWPFGRSVYRSELYKLIEEIDGVDYVKELKINGDDKLSEVKLTPVSLVDIARLRGDRYVIEQLTVKIEDASCNYQSF